MKMLIKNIQQAHHFFLDIVFPKYCVGCHTYGKWLCDPCLKRIPLHTNFFCPVCGHFSFQGFACAQCYKKSFLRGVWAVSDYKNAVVREAIKIMKYRYVKELGEILSALLGEYLALHDIKKKFDIIIPVPLHRRKFLARGFNQSEIFSRALSKYFFCPEDTEILQRRRFTFSQSKLEPERRRRNVKGAFFLSNAKNISQKSILLVDDVMTSGNTLQECARVLLEGGSGEVWGMVFARG